MKKLIAIIVASALAVAGIVVGIVMIATNSYKDYKIKFYSDDTKGTLLQESSIRSGSEVKYDYEKNGTPTKAASAEYTYSFVGWTDGENNYVLDAPLPKAQKDIEYWAYFNALKNSYRITFTSEDGSVVYYTQDLEYGVTPTYKGVTPTKSATAEYTYTFKGWDSEITSVTGTKTYKATFTAVKNQYHVTFLDDDGTTVKDQADLDYGAIPSYSKNDLARASHTFVGWFDGETLYDTNTPLPALTKDTTYTAVYVLNVVTQTEVATITNMSKVGEAGKLYKFNLVTVPTNNPEPLVFKLDDQELPIYVNGSLVTNYVPLNGTYTAYISDDYKVYLTEPEDVIQVVLTNGSTSRNLDLEEFNGTAYELRHLGVSIDASTTISIINYTRGETFDVVIADEVDNALADVIVTLII